MTHPLKLLHFFNSLQWPPLIGGNFTQLESLIYALVILHFVVERRVFELGHVSKPWAEYTNCSDAFGLLAVYEDAIWKPISKAIEFLFGFVVPVSSLRRYIAPTKEGGKAPSARNDNIVSSKTFSTAEDGRLLRRDAILKNDFDNIRGWASLLDSVFLAEAYGALKGTIIPSPPTPTNTAGQVQVDMNAWRKF